MQSKPILTSVSYKLYHGKIGTLRVVVGSRSLPPPSQNQLIQASLESKGYSQTIG